MKRSSQDQTDANQNRSKKLKSRVASADRDGVLPDVGSSSDSVGDGSRNDSHHIPLIQVLLQLANRTREHIRFSEQFQEASERIPSSGCPPAEELQRLGVNTCKVYGIDCEAVVTSDRPRALARVSIVEAMWPQGPSSNNVTFTTVMDVFVDPLSGSSSNSKIVDFKTAFSGISADLLAEKQSIGELHDCAGVRQRVREFLRQPLLRGALSFVVGHAIHNDLNMLDLQAEVGKSFEVIDTSCLFSYDSLPLKSIGLKALMKMVLERDVQASEDGHSSIEDSKSALCLVAHEARLFATFKSRTLPFPISVAPWSTCLQIFNVRKADEQRFRELMNTALQKQDRLREVRRSSLNSISEIEAVNQTTRNNAGANDEDFEISYERSSLNSSSLSVKTESSALTKEFELEELGQLNFRKRQNREPIGSMRMHFHTMERARSFWLDIGAKMPATSYMLDGEGFWQKKIVMVPGCSFEQGKRHPCSFYIKMFADRVPFTPREQALRTRTRRDPPPKSVKVRNPDKSLGVCIACKQSLANYWIRPVLPTQYQQKLAASAEQSQRYLHSSATHCARVIFGFGHHSSHTNNSSSNSWNSS